MRDDRPEHDDIERELAFHVEQRAREYMASGMDAEAARRAALARFGDLERVRNEYAQLVEADRRAERRRDWIDDLRRDVVLSLRSAVRTPLFTVLAVLTLALGVGANAAVFGVVKSVLLDPLPYADDDRLVRIEGRSLDGTSGRMALSEGALVDYESRQRSFERMAAFYPSPWEVIHRDDEGPRVLLGGYVAAGFFETLGVRPVLGRSFADGEVPNAGSYMVLVSHDLWQRDFGADPGVLGRTLRFDADTWEIIGVLPEGFTGPMGSADVWRAIDPGSAVGDPVRSRRSAYLGLVARLRAGVSVEAAERDLVAIASDLAREYPETDAGRTVTVTSLRETMVGETRTPLLILMASAVLVLIIACANLAGGLLSRTITRRGEFAVRTALGAGRGRLVRQLLTESTLLAVAGSLVGVALAELGLSVLRGLDLPALPRYADISLDAGALIVAAVVALCTGIAIGTAPAWSAVRSDTQGTLRDSGRGTSEGVRASRLRGLLLAGQIAASLSLLTGAGLLARSLVAMTSAPLGYDPHGVFTVSVKGPVPATDAARKQFFDALEQRVLSTPGVRAVTHSDAVPGPVITRSALAIEGVTWPEPDQPPLVPFVTVSDGYFETMRIPLLGGRGFGPQDGMESTPSIVISEAMARTWWPAGNAIGARVRIGSDASSPWAEVIGMAGDVRNDPARSLPEPMAYGAARQSPLRGSRIYLVRTDGDPLALVRPFRSALGGLDASVPMNDAGTLAAIVGTHLQPRRLPALLMTMFALLALLLASVGVYALFANLASAREREFAVRMALGSSPAGIAALVLRQGAAWTIAGLAGGAIGVAAIGQALRNLLYGVSPLDPLTIAAAIIALTASGTIALLVPVRRATRVDPHTIMR